MDPEASREDEWAIEDEAVLALELSPEPADPNDIDMSPDAVHAAAMCSYDNIGDALTPDTIGEYLDGFTFSRSLWMTVLHNSATPASSDQGLNTVKGFHNYHVNHNGWKCIGYHFVISTDGTIYAARKMSWTGAHAGNAGNPGSIGVCLVGNFETSDEPTEAQKVSLARLHTELHAHYYGDADITIRFHDEFMNTACPGDITVDEVMGWVKEYGKGDVNGSKQRPLIVLDGEELDKGVLVDGTTYAPLRSVFEAAGFDVHWTDAPDYRVMLTSTGGDVSWIGEWSMPCTGSKQEPLIVLDGVALDTGVLIDGTTYAPLRSVFEAAGFEVEWTGGPAWQVLLTSPQ